MVSNREETSINGESDADKQPHTHVSVHVCVGVCFKDKTLIVTGAHFLGYALCYMHGKASTHIRQHLKNKGGGGGGVEGGRKEGGRERERGGGGVHELPGS